MNLFQQGLMGLRRRQQLMYILLFSLATVVVWVVIGLITSQKKTPISAQQQELAKPLSPTLNRQVIDELKQKRSFSESELSNFAVYKVVITKDGEEFTTTLTEAERILSQEAAATPSPVAPAAQTGSSLLLPI